jgi:hypothetical protein
MSPAAANRFVAKNVSPARAVVGGIRSHDGHIRLPPLARARRYELDHDEWTKGFVTVR